jgi:hypothetical protein
MSDQPTETQLWVDNTEPLYNMKLAIWKNLMKKCRKGIYLHDEAKKAFRHLTDAAARTYKKEIHEPLDVPDRREAEVDFLAEYESATGCKQGRMFTAEHEAKVKAEYGLKGMRKRPRRK